MSRELLIVWLYTLAGLVFFIYCFCKISKRKRILWTIGAVELIAYFTAPLWFGPMSKEMLSRWTNPTVEPQLQYAMLAQHVIAFGAIILVFVSRVPDRDIPWIYLAAGCISYTLHIVRAVGELNWLASMR